LVIFARSNRSTLLFGWVVLGVVVALGAGAAALLLVARPLAALLVGMLALLALATMLRTALRLRRWPAARLGLFRDRLVLVQGRTEFQAQWDELDTVTLADQGDWAAGRWPEIRLTDRLTLRLRPRRRYSFRPAAFGLDPAACRDVMLRLRDDPALRRRLPEFDSPLDLVSRPLHTGDLIRPEL
jgi:hypothetical protein